MNCHVNLIPINPVEEREYERSDSDSVEKFKSTLAKYHINATIRKSMGSDIDAACGQLRRKYAFHHQEDSQHSSGKTDTGIKRNNNQDSIFFSDTPVGPLPNLYIVADGMGGHRAGDKASRMAIDITVDFVEKSTIENPVALLKRAMLFVNNEIYKAACADPDLNGMGTTMVAAVAQDGKLYVANVGDSRLYAIGGEIRQITMDHSLVEELIRKGELERKKGRNHPEKNIITKAMAHGRDDAGFFEIDITRKKNICYAQTGYRTWSKMTK